MTTRRYFALPLIIMFVCAAAATKIVKSPKDASQPVNKAMNPAIAAITPPTVLMQEEFAAQMVSGTNGVNVTNNIPFPSAPPVTNMVWTIKIPSGSICILEYCTNLSQSTGHSTDGLTAYQFPWPEWIYLSTIGATESNRVLQINIDVSKVGIAKQHFFRVRVNAGN